MTNKVLADALRLMWAKNGSKVLLTCRQSLILPVIEVGTQTALHARLHVTYRTPTPKLTASAASQVPVLVDSSSLFCGRGRGPSADSRTGVLESTMRGQVECLLS